MRKAVTHQSVLFVVTEVIGNGQRGDDRERKVEQRFQLSRMSRSN
jgi:hypothetical protein